MFFVINFLGGTLLGISLMSSETTKKGIVIILNGPSAIGKSTLQKAIQNMSDDFFIRLGIDNLFDGPLPDVEVKDFKFEPGYKLTQRVKKDGELIREVEIKKDEHGNLLIPLEVGSAGLKVVQGMHRALAAYADAGNNVIVDYILYDSSWLKDLITALKDYTVYFIGLHAPIEVLEAREKGRGTSPAGHARSHYDVVHQPGTYDLELDMSSLSSEQAAEKILTFVKTTPLPSAFSQLRQRR
jgi:chloramphenicol 3-O phosphotransferase